MQGPFSPVSGPSQPKGPHYCPQTKVFPMGQPSPPVYIVRAPAAPMTGMPHFQTHSFEPRTREKKIIQIKDPNSSKDVTQEILNRQSSGSLTCSTAGSPDSASPDVSGQCNSSSAPPLARQQEAEANVRAQFAVHVASTLASDNEKKPVKPVDYSIMQKAPVSSCPAVVTVINDISDSSKSKMAKATAAYSTVNSVTETQLAQKPGQKQNANEAATEKVNVLVRGVKPLAVLKTPDDMQAVCL